MACGTVTGDNMQEWRSYIVTSDNSSCNCLLNAIADVHDLYTVKIQIFQQMFVTEDGTGNVLKYFIKSTMLFPF